ncbi:hypothetical protein ACHWQZ_G018501 [Mnemiopsis leidyi]
MDPTDLTFALICFLCFAVGIPSNCISLYYFLRKTRDIPTCIYIVISSVDILTCVLVFPVGLSLAGNRNGMMFSSKVFCSLWGFTWELIPYYSVFLVFSLSFLRTFALLKPLVFIKKKVIVGLVIGYMIFLATRQLTGVFLGYSSYKYEHSAGYCWNHINHHSYQVSDAVFSTLQLAFPIIPITASCITSTVVILFSVRISRSSAAVTKMKKKATVTIIIVTFVYIIFNLPVFLNYTRYIVAVYWTGKDFLDVNNTNYFLQKYIWLLTYIITVALNSLVNPLIYMLRMRRFRSEVRGIFRRGGTVAKNQYNAHSHTDNHVILGNKSVIKNNSVSGGTNSTTLPGQQDSLKGQLGRPSLSSVQL